MKELTKTKLLLNGIDEEMESIKDTINFLNDAKKSFGIEQADDVIEDLIYYLNNCICVYNFSKNEIQFMGIIEKNKNDQYFIDDSPISLYAGEWIEYLDENVWHIAELKCGNNGFELKNEENKSLEGLFIRIRKNEIR